MRRGERREAFTAQSGQGQPHSAWTFVIGAALGEAGGDGAVGELDRAVRAQHEIIGDLSDRRAAPVAVTSNGQQELMLSRGESRRPCLSLAPVQEAPQTRAKFEQLLVGQVGGLTKAISLHDVVTRYRS